MKKSLLNFIDVFVACLALTGEDPNILPTSEHVLNPALKRTIDAGNFGEFGKCLTFTDGRMGATCVELPEIISYANRALLFSVLSPTFTESLVTMARSSAKLCLIEHGVREQEAIEWGRVFRENLKEVQNGYYR